MEGLLDGLALTDCAKDLARNIVSHHDGSPGLVTRSARCADDVVAVFTPNVLSEPQPACFLTYRLAADGVCVERGVGQPWLALP